MAFTCSPQAVGDDLLDSIVGDQIPIYTEEEKYNLTVSGQQDTLCTRRTS
jgi:hypothetical protein